MQERAGGDVSHRAEGGVENAKAHEEGDGTGVALLKNLKEI
jgi:hypothetical protein